MTHYRVPLFEQLRELLAREGISLKLLFGDPTPEEQSKRDDGEISWAIRLRTHYFAKGRLCWQPFGQHVRGADLVIVTQENRLIYNLWLLVTPFRRFRLAFWGHGRNFQSGNPDSFRERFKAWTTKAVDWWFAYTSVSAIAIEKTGFPRNRITVVNNAVDVRELSDWCKAIEPTELSSLQDRLGIRGTWPVVFLGSLTPEKRLKFLFEAADIVHSRVPLFRLLVVGDGPERERVAAAAARRPWIVATGALKGRDKVMHLMLANLLLMPGMVGLVILDSFAVGVPLVTTDCRIHSPEIAYLRDGINGIITQDSETAYASAIEHLLSDQSRLDRMKAAARADASEYSVEVMAKRFAQGIQQVLSEPPA